MSMSLDHRQGKVETARGQGSAEKDGKNLKTIE
jgi:hypothetical protein